jgi:hypothetical protein
MISDLQNQLNVINEAISRKEAAILVSIQRNSRIVHKRQRIELRILLDTRSKIERQIAQASK